MSTKIIADSACDLTEEMRRKMGIELVPLTLRLEDKEFVDDENLDVRAYIKAMNDCKTAPKTSCPSVQDFMDRYKDAENIFCVTISSKLSGTYNSAIQAKNAMIEEASDRFIHVFDSMSACIGETLVSLKVYENTMNNLKNIEVVDKVSNYIKEMKTFFLLESLEHLAKAGRINPLIAKAANMLSIKPVMRALDGDIRLVEKVRGYERAFNRLVAIIGEEGTDLEEKVLGISHCNCLDRALRLKAQIMKKYNFKDIILVETAGLGSTYMDDGGLVIAF